MEHTVVLGEFADIPSWLEIVRSVEPLFGHMPKFDVTLRTKMERAEALCVRDVTGRIDGGVLLGGEAPDIWIRWLAVRHAARRRGIGAAMVVEVIRRSPTPSTISLTTFGADIADGRAARRLYERFGFVAGAMLPRGPEGGTRQIYTLLLK
jgi:GNAT superfamily N-acetyltransferase